MVEETDPPAIFLNKIGYMTPASKVPTRHERVQRLIALTEAVLTIKDDKRRAARIAKYIWDMEEQILLQDDEYVAVITQDEDKQTERITYKHSEKKTRFFEDLARDVFRIDDIAGVIKLHGRDGLWLIPPSDNVNIRRLMEFTERADITHTSTIKVNDDRCALTFRIHNAILRDLAS